MAHQTQEQRDIVEIKGEIGRIRHHQDLQKVVNDEQKKMLTEIKNALIGSQMNGNMGLVNDVDNMKKQQKKDGETLTTHKIYFRQMAFVIGVIASAVVGVIIALIKHK